MNTSSGGSQSWLDALNQKFVKCRVPIIALIDAVTSCRPGRAMYRSGALLSRLPCHGGQVDINASESSKRVCHVDSGPGRAKICAFTPGTGHDIRTGEASGGMRHQSFNICRDLTVSDMRPIPFNHGKLGTMMDPCLISPKATTDLKDPSRRPSSQQPLHMVLRRGDQPAPRIGLNRIDLKRVQKGFMSRRRDQSRRLNLDKSSSLKELANRLQCLISIAKPFPEFSVGCRLCGRTVAQARFFL
jgi:hypothetical protein